MADLSPRMFSCPPGRRAARGFAIVELLVVMVIIGMLLTISLPAMRAVQDMSKRTVCANNLRQIGLAMQEYHTGCEKFPTGCIEFRINPAQRTKRQLAWSALLLPYLGQEGVFKQLDLTKAFDSPENAEAAATVLSVFLCPSSGRTTFVVEARGACDYGGIYGERILTRNNPPGGTMLIDRTVSTKQIYDGPAKTLLVSEDATGSSSQWINGSNIFDQGFAINNTVAGENDIRSRHRGGANAVFADARVKFLDESMDLKILAAICTRAGAEPAFELD